MLMGNHNKHLVVISNITGLLNVRGEENVDNYKEQTEETPGLQLVFASLSICP
jgi:hypothetical protein